MAGRDASQNLGGMLSQMGNSLGSMGGAGDALMRPIENTFRPQADPQDLGSMQELMRWQQGMGREDAARTTMAGIRDLRAEERLRKKEQEKLRQQNIQKATVASANRYRAAVASGDQAKINQENAIMDRMAESYGVDTAKIRAGVDQEKRTADLQGYQLQAAQARQEAEQVAKNINEAASTVIAKFGVDSKQFEQLKNAPLFKENRDIVQKIESRELQLLDQQERRATKMAEQHTPPNVTYLETMVNDERLNDPAMQEALEKIKEEIKGKESGKWLEHEKKPMLKRINDLERAASRRLTAIETAELGAKKADERTVSQLKSRRANESVAQWEVDVALDGLLKRVDLYGLDSWVNDQAITKADVDQNTGVLKPSDIGKTPSEVAKERVLEEKTKPYDDLIASYGSASSSSSSDSSNLMSMSAPSGVDPKLWAVMTEEERRAVVQ